MLFILLPLPYLYPVFIYFLHCMTQTTVNRPVSRVVWLDVVRLVAMFTVVCCHCTDPFNFYPGTSPHIADIKFWGAAYGAALRPCVPLFVMITGALLLPVQGDTGAFYKKRISRVFFPFLIWSVLYNLFPWLTGLLGVAPEVILDFFPYSGEDVMRQSLAVSMGYIGQIPVNFSILAVHMWYIYLLIGLYLYLPVFSAWVSQASERAKRWFLAAWGVTLLLPYVHEFAGQYVWGECSWNAFGTFYYFAGFNGYLLLGHYLRHHDWSRMQAWGWGIPMFVLGYVVTFFGFRHMTALPGCTDEQLELFFTYCSLNVVMMTIPVFMWCKRVNIRSERIQRLLANLTLCGFGVYMIHYFFAGPSVLLMRALQVPIPLQIPLAAIVAFGVSWCIVAAVYKVIGSRARWVMG